MGSQEGPQRGLKERANDLVARLSPSERESLLIKCWMSHDARWFMAVAGEYGIQVANRLNQIAAREVGKAEARRLVRALRLPSVKTLDDYLLAQEAFIALVGPDLLDYEVTKIGENGCEVRVRRCFANENAVRAGIIDSYECGIFARVTGYPEALGLKYEMTPPLGKCLKFQGQECIYRFAFTLAGQRLSGGRNSDHGL
jgi:hypothetical protein